MISITSEPWAEMVAHARAVYPNECCGAMLGSIDGDTKQVTSAVRLDNASSGSQRARYELRPEDLLNADAEARRQGLDLIDRTISFSNFIHKSRVAMRTFRKQT